MSFCCFIVVFEGEVNGISEATVGLGLRCQENRLKEILVLV